MGYRGEDVSAAREAWGHQTPWQSSSDEYPPADYPATGGDGYGYGTDGGYREQGQAQPGQGQQEHQYGGGYEQPQYGDQPSYGEQPPSYGEAYGQPSGQYGGYEPAGGDAGGYAGHPGYGQQAPADYGYDAGHGAGAGYGQPGVGQPPAPGYGPGPDQPAAPGYGPGPDQPAAPGHGYGQPAAPGYGGGYDQPAGYQQPAAPGYGSGGYPGGDGGYQDSGAYRGQGGYQERPAGGGYQGQGQGPGGYQDRDNGYSQPGGYQEGPAGGGRAALTSGSQETQSAADAGNDWYSGQPAAANGASFADTGAYRLNGRVIDEYGTGPRDALRDPVRGYPPGPGDGGPTAVIPAISAPLAAPRGGQTAERGGQTGPRRSGQPEGYDDSPQYPAAYGQDEPAGRPAAPDAYDYPTRAGFAAPGAYAAPGYEDDFDQGPSPRADPAGYDDYVASDDPYQDRYGDGAAPLPPGTAGRGPGKSGRGGSAGGGPLGGKRFLLAALAVVAVGIIGAALYVFVIKPTPKAANPNASGPIPTGSAVPSTQACTKTLGTYCHIETRANDAAPLTTAEVFPPAFTTEGDKISYQLATSKLDKTCSSAVIGADLIKQLKAGHCTQVVRASYVSGNGKIMGTIGVVNLATTNEAHDAGKVVGKADFIAPLTATKGAAAKLGKGGTGVVEAEFKGHYLILTWSEFVDGTNPSTKAEDTQLEQFSNDLVSETANVDLSQRMVTGAAPTPAASA
jgi:hypothetical protein